MADDSDSFVIQIDKGDYHVTFEFYGNEEVKTIDEIEEVEVIEGEDGDDDVSPLTLQLHGPLGYDQYAGNQNGSV